MTENLPDAKERIMNTVVQLMLEQKDISKITNREIAALAGVNSALINYYYQSKENLLNQAVGVCMGQMAGNYLSGEDQGAGPVQRLKTMLEGISRFAVEYRFLSEIAVGGELRSGNENTVKTILPILNEIFDGRKTALELKLLALQIVVPLQVILLNQSAYLKTLDENVTDMTKCFSVLDILINNIIKTNLQ